MANEEVTTRMHVDISELKKSMQDARRQIRLANAQFREASAAMEDWKHCSEGLEAKLRQLRTTMTSQRSILSSLEQQYAQVAAEQGESSSGAQELAIQIAHQRAAISNTERSISQYENALVDLNTESNDVADNSRTAARGIEAVGNSANKAGKQTGGFAKGLANLAKTGMAAVAAAAVGVVTAFLGSAEATREYREDMNKLQTTYKTAGSSAKTATEMYKSFFSVLGEEDRSVESVNHLAELTKKQDELAKWTDICAGVWGTFGDSLPIEGLTEAANETAKVGQVTGLLADALNWVGISEDEFNKKLKKCNSEQERATLITNTLNETYAEAAKNYKELNGDIMDAQRAQSELTDTMAKLGAAAEPVMTTFKLLGVSLLTGLLPGVEKLGKGLNDMMNGVDGAGEVVGSAVSDLVTSLLDKIAQALPQVMEIGVSLVSNLAKGLLSAIPQLLTTSIQMWSTFMTSLSSIIPEIVLAVVDSIPVIIEAFMKQLPVFIQACITFLTGMVDALPQVIQAILQALPQLITSIINGLMSGIDALTQGAITLLMAIVDAIPQITGALIEALPTIIDAIITGLVTALPQLLEAGIALFMALVEALPTIIVALTEALPDIIDAITTTLLDNMPVLLNCAVTLFMALVDAIPQIVVALGKAIPKIRIAIMEALLKIIPKLVSFGITVRKKVLEFFVDITKKAAKKTGEFVSKIKDKIKDLPEDMQEILGKAVQKVSAFGENLKEKAQEAGKKLAKGIKEKIKSLPDDIKSIGGDIVSGLWNGIDNKFEWLTGKIKGFSKDVTGKLKEFFGIHSPSRVMRDEVGKYLSLGIAEGITKNKDAVKKAMSNLANDIANPLDFGIESAKRGVVSGSGSGGRSDAVNNSTSNSYTFNQYNTSPKALSRLEIYRQTRNQLNFAKGV